MLVFDVRTTGSTWPRRSVGELKSGEQRSAGAEAAAAVPAAAEAAAAAAVPKAVEAVVGRCPFRSAAYVHDIGDCGLIRM